MKKEIEIISWNVNGIRAVSEKNAFDWLYERRPNILCLQEIKATQDQVPQTPLDKLFVKRTINSGTKKGHSGTMTLSNIKISAEDTAQHIDILDEGRIVEHHYNNLVVFNVYFPNGQSDENRLKYKMEFYDRFLNYCQKLRAEGKSIVICGDVNTAHKPIDLKNPKANEKTSGFLPMEREWIDKLLSLGYVDTFRHIHGEKKDEYSWWSYRFQSRSKNTGWRIDYFFISEDLLPNLKDAFILQEVMGSDHCPVGIKLELE